MVPVCVQVCAISTCLGKNSGMWFHQCCQENSICIPSFNLLSSNLNSFSLKLCGDIFSVFVFKCTGILVVEQLFYSVFMHGIFGCFILFHFAWQSFYRGMSVYVVESMCSLYLVLSMKGHTSFCFANLADVQMFSEILNLCFNVFKFQLK